MKGACQCRECGSTQTAVKDSRKKEGGIWRIRECVRCGARWSTIEVDFWEWKKILKKVDSVDN